MRRRVNARIIIASTLLLAGKDLLIQAQSHRSPTAPKKSLVEAAETVSHSVVMVRVEYTYVNSKDSSANTLTSWGTGFIVNAKGEIATAYHVIDEAFVVEELKKQGIVVSPGSMRAKMSIVEVSPNRAGPNGEPDTYNGQFGYSATVYKADPDHDIAILDCARNFLDKSVLPLYITKYSREEPMRLPSFDISNPRQGEQISLSGFPNADEYKGSMPGLVLDTGIISNPLFRGGGKHGFVYVGEIHISHGDSGGPVFNERGEIIGLLLSYFLDNNSNRKVAQLAEILPIRVVLKLAS